MSHPLTQTATFNCEYDFQELPAVLQHGLLDKPIKNDDHARLLIDAIPRCICYQQRAATKADVMSYMCFIDTAMPLFISYFLRSKAIRGQDAVSFCMRMPFFLSLAVFSAVYNKYASAAYWSPSRTEEEISEFAKRVEKTLQRLGTFMTHRFRHIHRLVLLEEKEDVLDLYLGVLRVLCPDGVVFFPIATSKSTEKLEDFVKKLKLKLHRPINMQFVWPNQTDIADSMIKVPELMIHRPYAVRDWRNRVIQYIRSAMEKESEFSPFTLSKLLRPLIELQYSDHSSLTKFVMSLIVYNHFLDMESRLSTAMKDVTEHCDEASGEKPSEMATYAMAELIDSINVHVVGQFEAFDALMEKHRIVDEELRRYLPLGFRSSREIIEEACENERDCEDIKHILNSTNWIEYGTLCEVFKENIQPAWKQAIKKTKRVLDAMNEAAKTWVDVRGNAIVLFSHSATTRLLQHAMIELFSLNADNEGKIPSKRLYMFDAPKGIAFHPDAGKALREIHIIVSRKGKKPAVEVPKGSIYDNLSRVYSDKVDELEIIHNVTEEAPVIPMHPHAGAGAGAGSGSGSGAGSGSGSGSGSAKRRISPTLLRSSGNPSQLTTGDSAGVKKRRIVPTLITPYPSSST